MKFIHKNKTPFVFDIKKNMRIACLLLLIIPLIIFIRLFYLQTFLHEEFSSKADRAIYNFLAEDRLRGKVLDVNGRTLAESVRTHSCGINKRYVKDKKKTIEFLAETLEMPVSKINEKWEKAGNFFFVKKKIEPNKYIKIAEILRTPLGQGLELTPEYDRIHPYGESALDIVGAANSKNLGLSGIEQMFNSKLSQNISKKRAKRARRGEIIYDRKLREKLSVANIYLTIDELIQYHTEKALLQAVQNVGAQHGIAVVQEPNSGKILAAASFFAKEDPDTKEISYEIKKKMAYYPRIPFYIYCLDFSRQDFLFTCPLFLLSTRIFSTGFCKAFFFLCYKYQCLPPLLLYRLHDLPQISHSVSLFHFLSLGNYPDLTFPHNHP